MTEKEKELFQGRIKKLQELRKAGIDPYPSKAARTHTNREAVEHFDKLSEKTVTLVGRIRSMRDMGKISFANLEDETGKIQVLFKEGNLGNYKNVINQLDIGDFIEVGGALFKTKTGEKTVEAKDLKLLSKSLSALPEKWHGLADTETKLRKRYLDMIANPEVREMFRKKSVFWQTIREFLKEKGFLEVETPVLENVPGGAEAEPFVTHHKALDRDFFLRISLELPLKKLLVGGFGRVFEIGRIFRNEGISTEHLQDYTQCEFYWAYADYEDLMSLLKEFYRKIVKDLFGTTKVKNQGVEVDWGKEWKRYDYYELFQKETGLDLNKANDKDLKKLADKLKIKYEKFAQKGRLVDLLYKKTVRPKLVEPGFLLDPPVEVEPLAKRHPKDPNRVQRLQVMAWGTELGKGFTELNDPLDQRIRFEEQMKLREAGDKEAQMIDEDFIEALEYGMPPAAGFGLSERLFAVLMDKSVRETVIFPPMKQEK